MPGIAVIAAADWHQTATDVLLVTGVVTAVLTAWARLFSGPIGRWIDKRIAVAVQPLHADLTEMRTADLTEMRTANTLQHAQMQSEISTLSARLDDHLRAVRGDGR